MRYRYHTLKEMFSQNYNFKVSINNARNIINYCRGYELRQSHPEALNSPYLGVHKMYFLPQDQNFLFDEFDATGREVRQRMLECENVNPDHNVISDPYNMFTMWVVYKIRTGTTLSKSMAEDTQVALIKLLHYKFFTSKVNRLFPHTANEDVMAATIESLSGKYALRKKETSTWRLFMTARSYDVIGPDSIHKKALNTFTGDKEVTYAISDIQTRLRNNLRLITNAYYETRERAERMSHYTISDEIDGEQLLKSVEAIYDQMVISISKDALSVDAFINAQHITVVCGLVKGLRPDLMRRFLTKFSDMCITQHRTGKERGIETKGDFHIYKGYRDLIEHTVTATYAAVLRNRDVNVKSKLSILQKVQHQYKASRMSDQGILNVKASLSMWVEELNLSSRSETQGALRIAFVLYIILLSFKSM